MDLALRAEQGDVAAAAELIRRNGARTMDDALRALAVAPARVTGPIVDVAADALWVLYGRPDADVMDDA